ncbi:transporter substrate-binding domain-containing protein [Catenovulum sediminis]|uniref:transporter substrate-binding domain-containing protein n=1 Tax=Catenovulum sediminis TaxID=1740262 RepID=UPI00117ECDCA|nr:transporter substrate-binding domain-containing protein [Catenovulum sediminis]
MFQFNRFFKTLLVTSMSMIFSPQLTAADTTGRNIISFWNGNKSEIRQSYESEVFATVIKQINQSLNKSYRWHENRDTLSIAEESSIFSQQEYDVFVSVAGNPKLDQENKILIPIPLMQGLLGTRLMIINERDRVKFATIKTKAQLQALYSGIPAGWADAKLFRANNFNVNETGTFDDILLRLKRKQFDYFALGANEIESVYEQRVTAKENLIIEPTLALYYPFPVVFYVNPNRAELAQQLRASLHQLVQNETLNKIFARYFAQIQERLNLTERKFIHLENPLLPKALAN